jgi:NTE family protein
VVNADEAWTEALLEQDVLQWWRFLDLEAERGGLICPDHLIEFLRRESGVERFDQLAIPLDVVATDFWERSQLVIDSGALWPAVRASMALPGLFPPVRHLGRTLVDGGLVNPVPYDLLLDRCDLVVAVDVLGRRTPQDGPRPGYLENLFNSVQIMQAALTRERLRNRPPDVYVEPDLVDIRVLDFFKADRIMHGTEPARQRLEERLRAIPGLVAGP